MMNNVRVIVAVALSGSMAALAAPKVVPQVPLSADGEKLSAGYSAMLEALRAELTKSIPVVDARKISALDQARAATKKAAADAAAARAQFDKLKGAEGLVGHAKGKWIGGADKGIAAAQAALAKATTDAAREAAKKDLAHWQANREDGVKALKERQAALDALKVDEPKLVAADKAAQSAMGVARTNELKLMTYLLNEVGPFLSSDKLDAKLVQCAVLVQATPRGLAEFAEQSKEHSALIGKLLSDTSLMKEMLAAGGPEGGKYGPAIQIYTAIQKASPRAKDGLFQRLALATSLEHAVPVKQGNPADATNAPAVVDPVKRYLHFEKAYLDGELDPAFKGLTAWEYRNVVNGDESDETLAWGREMLRNHRPDHVLNPDAGWRYSRAVATDVRYGSQDVKNDLPSLQPYQNIIKNGGVCGRRAFFGRFILRAFGIPTVARPQVGHAALARWTANGWVINLGAGWGYPEAKGVMEMTDADFVMETQARKQPQAYEKALRAQWAGEVLGEQKYVSLKPGNAGLWNMLAVYQKKLIAAAAKPVETAALGQELGEANESAETRARPLVKATVTDEDKKIAIAPNGVITIPAAACSGAQILGSFLGGHQLFSGGGTISFNLEVPNAGRYMLAARVSTVQDNPKMLLTVNDSKQPVEVTVPYTIGKWQQTAPAPVNLAQGKNSLRLTRPSESRGLTIKEFTLTPAR